MQRYQDDIQHARNGQLNAEKCLGEANLKLTNTVTLLNQTTSSLDGYKHLRSQEEILKLSSNLSEYENRFVQQRDAQVTLEDTVTSLNKTVCSLSARCCDLQNTITLEKGVSTALRGTIAAVKAVVSK